MKKDVKRFYTLDEVLPLINDQARAYAETDGDKYVCGVEIDDARFPIVLMADASDADYYVEELDKQIESKISDAKETHTTVELGADEEERALLEGFNFVPNDGMPTIFVGKRNRLYLKSKGFNVLFDIKPKSRIIIAYNSKLNAFAIVNPKSPAVTDEMKRAGYYVSNRMDVTCARLFRDFDLDKYEGRNFYVDETSMSGNVIIFRAYADVE